MLNMKRNDEELFAVALSYINTYQMLLTYLINMCSRRSFRLGFYHPSVISIKTLLFPTANRDHFFFNQLLFLTIFYILTHTTIAFLDTFFSYIVEMRIKQI